MTAWESGYHQHPVDRALTILDLALPEMTWDQLASLSIVRRDQLLLTLWEITFGSTLHGVATCPQCSEHLEFTFASEHLRAECAEEYSYLLEIKESAVSVRFRLPNSYDLAAALRFNEMTTARAVLAQRCTLEATCGKDPLAPEELSEELFAALSQRMEESAPYADVLMELVCPSCAQSWKTGFDILVFLWSAVSVNARRLAWEVHQLASAYGWREADILSMSAFRRQFYLGMMG